MNNTFDSIRAMKNAEFANFGVPVVAYVKKVQLVNGITAYALHGADGAPIGIEANEDLATLAVRHKNMMPVMVQ